MASLEARIAQLDERLRAARQENDALRTRGSSPSPRHPSSSAPRSPANVSPKRSQVAFTNYSGNYTPRSYTDPNAGTPRRDLGATTTTAGANTTTQRAGLNSSSTPVSSTRGDGSSSTLKAAPTSASTTTTLRQQPNSPAPQRRMQSPAANNNTSATSGGYGGGGPAVSPSRTYMGPTSPPAPVSPWREVALATQKATEAVEAEQRVRQATHKEHVSNNLRELQERLIDTNRTVNMRESEVIENQRRRAVAAAENLRDLDRADSRLQDLERQATQNHKKITELQSEKTSLLRQVDETKVAINRAENRADDLLKEQVKLEARIREANAALRERERVTQEETEQFNIVRRRLETRIADLQDENHQGSERLRKLEATQDSQEQQWREEEASLERECAAAAELQHEIESRLMVLKSELADREKEAETQRQTRERRVEEMAKQSEENRRRDAAKAREEMQQREADLLKDRDDQVHAIQVQIEQVEKQIERKRRSRESQEALIQDLERKLAEAQTAASRKAQLGEQCNALDDEVLQLQQQRDQNRDELNRLHSTLHERDTEIAQLDRTAQRLSQKLDEERRLKDRVAELAKEVNEANMEREGERAVADRQMDDLQRENEAANEELRVVNLDITRAREAGRAEIDALSRKQAALRAQVADKETALNTALQENAAKQAAIAQFEEEKRQMERESLTRRAAATNAAKAALLELNV